MKSTDEQLKERGFISDKELKKYFDCSDDQLFSYLNGKSSFERTAAIKIIAKKSDIKFINLLCEKLFIENKLYTKIALCECLTGYGFKAVPYLLPMLGKIGNNQHKAIALVDIGKKSFPLPRDIVARILIRIGPIVFEETKKIIATGDRNQILEAIDVVGHVTWKFQDYSCEDVLIELFEKTGEDILMQWKIIRAFQSFKSTKIINILEKVTQGTNEVIVSEAKRSLHRINSRVFP
ncbi:MAG: hypothetical protein CVU52_02275 [Deltaproteobacteria bacterium HGW-Deltaproteobacteria-10]|nr:MAG: hypothetical protein CVU52_02275 [Deltaproteobacteria bacterium HGW-Deltaproteobacteria-10]